MRETTNRNLTNKQKQNVLQETYRDNKMNPGKQISRSSSKNSTSLAEICQGSDKNIPEKESCCHF